MPPLPRASRSSRGRLCRQGVADYQYVEEAPWFQRPVTANDKGIVFNLPLKAEDAYADGLMTLARSCVERILRGEVKFRAA